MQPPASPETDITVSSTKPATISWLDEVKETLKLGWPLVIAQIATIALNTTDVIMIARIGPEYLGAGSLAHSVLYPFYMLCFGIVLATAPMIAQALGAKKLRSVRRTIRQGFWLSIVLSVLVIPILQMGDHIMRLFRQDELTALLADDYLDFAGFMILPALLFLTLRSLSSAHGETRIILIITLAGIVVNAAANYLLIFGKFGFPRMELAGAGLATVIVHWAMFGLLLLYVLKHRRMKRYGILVRLWKPDWQRFLSLIRLGGPIGLMLAAETMLFGAAGVLMGWISTDALAGHAVALQIAAITFMVPLGLSQATSVRVGLAHGRGDYRGRATAGWVSIVLSLAFMSCAAITFVLIPETLVYLFLSPGLAENMVPIQLAVSYLMIAALFQLVDGTQAIAGAALRGMSDTTVPMIIAITGYWIIGIPTGYLLGFVYGMEGQGVWLGLATGLMVAAVVLVHRFALLCRVKPAALGSHA